MNLIILANSASSPHPHTVTVALWPIARHELGSDRYGKAYEGESDDMRGAWGTPPTGYRLQATKHARFRNCTREAVLANGTPPARRSYVQRRTMAWRFACARERVRAYRENVEVRSSLTSLCECAVSLQRARGMKLRMERPPLDLRAYDANPSKNSPGCSRIARSYARVPPVG